MIRLRSVLVPAVALGLVSTATLVTASAATARTLPPTTQVQVAQHHRITMDTTLSPGVNRFHIRSAKNAGFQIVRAAPGYSKKRLAHDADAGVGGGNIKALKRFEANVTLLGGVASAPKHPGVLLVNLPRGTYWVADTNARHTNPAKLRTIHVGGARTGARMPRTATVKAINDTDWGKLSQSISHDGLLRFANRSQDNHFLELAKLAPGKTMRDFRRWINKVKNGENAGPPPVVQRVNIDTGVISPGHSMTFHYRLPRGHYVMICWWPDADMGGMPHAFMGMYRGITLT